MGPPPGLALHIHEGFSSILGMKVCSLFRSLVLACDEGIVESGSAILWTFVEALEEVRPVSLIRLCFQAWEFREAFSRRAKHQASSYCP